MTLAEVETSERARNFVFERADWAFYERALELGESQRIRINYDCGRMEVMTRTDVHESIKTAIARVLEMYAFEMDIAIEGRGEVTCRREDLEKGLEPDECYFIVNQPLRTAEGHLDLINGPPPDLAIEIEVSRTVVARQPILASLRVPEVWRIDEERITPMELRGTEYIALEKSRFFPDLDFVELNRFLRMALNGQHAALKAFQTWINANRGRGWEHRI